MSIAFVQVGSVGTSGTSTSLAFGSNVTAGSLLLAYCYGNNGVAYTSVTDNQNDGPGSTYQLAFDVNMGANNHVSLYYAWNAVGGATTVTAHGSASDAFGLLLISEYSGVYTGGDPLDGANGQKQIGQSVVTSGNFTTTYPGDLLYGAFFDNNQGVDGTDHGFALRANPGFGTFASKDIIGIAPGTWAAIANGNGGNPQVVIGAAFRAQGAVLPLPPASGILTPIITSGGY